MSAKEEEQHPLDGEIAMQSEKHVAIQDDGNSSEKANALKLDPHGLPLQPQPSSDPKGMVTDANGSPMTRLTYNRPIELEQMVQALGLVPGLDVVLLEPVNPSCDRKCPDR